MLVGLIMTIALGRLFNSNNRMGKYVWEMQKQFCKTRYLIIVFIEVELN